MTMTPRVRKLALIAHVTSSVGWLGAVAAFLALAIAGLVRQDAQTVRSAYLAMDLTYWFVIVPLCFASLLTGVVSSLGTRWGLFRHYWVLLKLVLTVPATILLIVHTQPVSFMAGVAAQIVPSGADLGRLRIELVVYAGAALLVLLAAMALSAYKPRGLTLYGVREQRGQGDAGADARMKLYRGSTAGKPRWVKIFGSIVLVVVVALVILRHAGIVGTGMHHMAH